MSEPMDNQEALNLLVRNQHDLARAFSDVAMFLFGAAIAEGKLDRRVIVDHIEELGREAGNDRLRISPSSDDKPNAYLMGLASALREMEKPPPGLRVIDGGRST